MKLEVKHLNVEINKSMILRDVSLGVAENEFHVLLGPSGCGKSTLLKTIAGINRAESGSIILDGTVINDVPPHKRGTVIVFQDMRLFPNMSVSENVAYPLRIKRVKKEERRARAAQYLSYVRLEGFDDRRISSLSGGQLQRVSLARALAAEPKILLMDEPFSSLDENLRDDMRRLVTDIRREFGITTIMVTHDRREAVSMADRISLMFEGHIIQTGRPDEVSSQPADERVSKYFGQSAF